MKTKPLPLIRQGYTRSTAKLFVGPGWHALIDRIYDQLPTDAFVSDVKEKWGGLRLSVYDVDESVFDFIDAIESESLRTCEVCGNPGQPRDTGWIKTLCDTHAP